MTAEEWASKIRELIEEACADGKTIGGYSDCCGCSQKIFLTVSSWTGSNDTTEVRLDQ